MTLRLLLGLLLAGFAGSSIGHGHDCLNAPAGSCPPGSPALTGCLTWADHQGFILPREGVRINPNHTEADCPPGSDLEATLRAMNTWNQSGFNFIFTYKGITSNLPFHSGDDPNSTDLLNVIGWYPGSLGAGVLARTWTIYECWGEIVEADIEVSTIYLWWCRPENHAGSTYDYESVMLHELGHFIGLDHSSVSASVMWGPFSTTRERRSLHADDIQGGLALYGESIPLSGVEDFIVYE